MTRIRAAFIALLIASVALAAYGDRISGNGPEFLPRDPGAIRASGGGPTANWIDFTTGAGAPSWAEGRMFWDKDNGTLGMYSEVDGNEAMTPILQIGQEMWIRVKNAGVATMTNGSVVYLSSPLSGKDPIAQLAKADASSTSSIVGVVTADIPPDGSGYATAMGLVRHLDTSAYTEGQKIFLSAADAGKFTGTAPAAPNTSVIIGYVIKAHETAGVIYVRVWLNGSIEPAVFHNTSYFAGASTFTAGINANAITCDAVDGVDVSAHVTDNSDVHGCTAIASASAVADALSAANASDALNLRLDGSRAVTGNLRLSGNYGLIKNTSDGSDNGYLYLSGGGGSSVTRGATIYINGNEAASEGGWISLYAGNVSGGAIQFVTKDTERMRLTYDGNVLINTTSDDGTNKLQVNGHAAAQSFRINNNEAYYCKDTGGVNRAIAFISSGDVSYFGHTSYPTRISSNGTLTHNGNTIWTAASDGAGSGLDADKVPNATPASASATGTAGMIRYDANYIYICTAANTWKRAAISTW